MMVNTNHRIPAIIAAPTSKLKYAHIENIILCKYHIQLQKTRPGKEKIDILFGAYNLSARLITVYPTTFTISSVILGVIQ